MKEAWKLVTSWLQCRQMVFMQELPWGNDLAGVMSGMVDSEIELKLVMEEQLSYFERVHKETPMVNLSVRHVIQWGVTDEDLCKAYGCISRKLRYLRALVVKREIEGINVRLEKRDIAAFEIGLLLIARYQFKRGITPAKFKEKNNG